MKKIFFPLVIALITVLTTACSSDGHYKVEGDTVVFTYWTFSFGRLNDTLPGADAASFESVKNWLGHDSKRVYFKDKPVVGADVATIKAKRYPLSYDKNDYYYETVPMRVADMTSFKVIKWIEDDFWAKDSRCAYYDTLRIDDVDLPTFKVMALGLAKDKNHVYSMGEVLPIADPETFEPIGSSLYYRDKFNIWCGDELMQNVDYETFTVDGTLKAHDKYGAFRGERRVTETDNP